MTNKKHHSEILIIGAGVIGLALAKILKEENPNLTINVIEKEADVAFHSSGRNSGVLHAGFYYTANSLKAKFTREGCAYWTKYCEDNDLKINKCRKVVVAQNESEVAGIEELYRRGVVNGVDVKIITEAELKELDPNIKTHKIALYSPNTATVNPVEICQHLRKNLEKQGVRFFFSEGYSVTAGVGVVKTVSGDEFSAAHVINAAGLYADKIARDYGFCQDYTIVPFKGIYLKYTGEKSPVTMNVYPVPNLENPFLGVHYTITVDNEVKIGPTAIPAFWRENYEGFSRFSLQEFLQVAFKMAELFIKNPFRFRHLAIEEMRKYNRSYFVNLATSLVHQVNAEGFNKWSKPGIRAQLLNLKNNQLVQDFVVEGDKATTHVLNAVSPAFTSAIPFAKWIVANYIRKTGVMHENHRHSA